ncbi:hypothetical protein FHX45_000676 [Amycolatopsis granulosa]|nr:hypothetical protein [Amycolatopsis granulosa]NIH83783.1 hypothetical protein [Amycolatopsis granulosa]
MDNQATSCARSFSTLMHHQVSEFVRRVEALSFCCLAGVDEDERLVLDVQREGVERTSPLAN